MGSRKGQIVERCYSGIAVTQGVAGALQHMSQTIAYRRIRQSRHGHIDHLQQEIVLGRLGLQFHQRVATVASDGHPVAWYWWWCGFDLWFSGNRRDGRGAPRPKDSGNQTCYEGEILGGNMKADGWHTMASPKLCAPSITGEGHRIQWRMGTARLPYLSGATRQHCRPPMGCQSRYRLLPLTALDYGNFHTALLPLWRRVRLRPRWAGACYGL